jgi:uncharacterized membrane protein
MQQKTHRITSIDTLRGIVVMLMALDHVRDYFHNQAFTHNPLDVNEPHVAAFFTRWVTHFCAPVFIFLAGTSAYLSGQKKSGKEQQLFLIKRGLWLIFIELTIVNFGWTFNPYFPASILQVIWAIGACMVLLGLMVRLSHISILSVGVAITLFHNLLDYLPEEWKSSAFFNIMHTNGFKFFPITDTYGFVTVYGILPWFGVMCLGYSVGQLFKADYPAAMRQSRLKLIGISALLLFVVLRVTKFYGDPSLWQQELLGVGSWLSFINVTKYPPSLHYVLLMLGPSILLLAYLEKWNTILTRIISVFGNVPFFFYIIHIYLIHALCIVLFFAQGFGLSDIMQKPFWFRPEQLGLNLPWVYLVWIGVLIMLYPLCVYFMKLKQRKKDWWMSYL